MRDLLLSKEQLRKIIEYLPIQQKAMILLLKDTGVVIGDIQPFDVDGKMKIFTMKKPSDIS